VRDVKEIGLAILIRLRFSPEQQKTIYLNRVYFGECQYGVEQAAQHYFGRSVSQLSTAEAALLAGLIKNPAYYSPDKHPDRAVVRRNVMIERMRADGSLNAAEAVAAESAPLGVLMASDRQRTR
jgi:membrane peptidoglycan carboxypeptidase